MKKIIIITLIFSTQIFAQNIDRKINRFVKEKNVKRIIKTLSADEMLGRDSKKPEEIEKSAQFIANEFQKIGLNQFGDSKDFRQKFTTINISNGIKNVLFDGVKIPENEVLVFSEMVKIDFEKNQNVLVLDKSMNFWENFRKWNRDSTDKIVLVDSFHEEAFNQANSYYGNSRIIVKNKVKSGNAIYVLGHEKPTNIVASITQKIVDLPMANVVGVLDGKSKKDEFVIFSSHYDHLGNIAVFAGDSIANGADDDASGTTAVISLAKYFKKLNNNERTLVFVAFTAEEIGGFGSKYFSENMNPDKVMAMVNIEMIGKASKWGKNSAFITGFEKSNLGVIMQKNLVGTPFAINPDPYPKQNLFYRSDNATLARQGVPAHSFSTDQIDSDKLYHSVDDEYESLDVSNIVATIKALAIATKTIVSGIDTPSRVDKAGVRN